MHKITLFLEVQQDGASPPEDSESSPRCQCRALIRREPVPDWLVLYRKLDLNK